MKNGQRGNVMNTSARIAELEKQNRAAMKKDLQRHQEKMTQIQSMCSELKAGNFDPAMIQAYMNRIKNI